MSDLSESSLEQAIIDIRILDNMNVKPNRMLLNQDSIDLMTEDELEFVQKEGLLALPKERREFLTRELMKKWRI